MADRSIDTGREAIGDRGNSPTIDAPTTPTTSRELSQPRESNTRDVSGRGITEETKPPQVDNQVAVSGLSNAFAAFTPPSLVTNTAVPNGTTTTQAPLYGDTDPFRIAADIFSRFYGGAPQDKPQAPVVVGDASQSSGSGSNAGLFLVIAIVIGVGYFLYKRYAK